MVMSVMMMVMIGHAGNGVDDDGGGAGADAKLAT